MRKILCVMGMILALSACAMMPTSEWRNDKGEEIVCGGEQVSTMPPVYLAHAAWKGICEDRAKAKGYKDVSTGVQ